MRILILLFTIITSNLSAQVKLNFDKLFVECEDRWVAFEKDEDDSYQFGFIYIDAEAGLTFNSEGNFQYKKDGSLQVEKVEGSSIKVRLKPNNVKVAIIPESYFKELKIDKSPQWLKYYKKDTNSVQRLYKWGFMYNGWNQCAKALTYLEKAKKINSRYKGLSVELAFSYNCLEQYEKAERILEREIKLNPSSAYIHKEYIYTLAKSQNIDKAKKQFIKSVELLEDKTYHAENCFNILQFYYYKNDKKNFNQWHKELGKHKSNNPQIHNYADLMKDKINK